MIKRFFAFLLVLSLLGTTLQIISFAESSDFEVVNGVLNSYSGNSMDVVIPDDLGITSIGTEAFAALDKITSVSIPNTVTIIEVAAFWGCTGLTAIEIPGSVTNIYDAAFFGCSGLTTVTISEGTREIGMDAFLGCTGLTSIKLPSTITNIGPNAFGFCSSLSKVFFMGDAPIIGENIFNGTADNLSLYYLDGKSDYSTQQWTAFQIKVIKLGDANGDGAINTGDLAAIKMHLLKQYFLIDENEIAADIFHRNRITISDLIAVKKMILNIS